MAMPSTHFQVGLFPVASVFLSLSEGLGAFFSGHTRKLNARTVGTGIGQTAQVLESETPWRCAFLRKNACFSYVSNISVIL